MAINRMKEALRIKWHYDNVSISKHEQWSTPQFCRRQKNIRDAGEIPLHGVMSVTSVSDPPVRIIDIDTLGVAS